MIEELLKIAEKIEFNHIGHVCTKDIIFDPELRKSCEANTCGSFGRNWVCPPHSGPIEVCISKAQSYENAIVVQYIGELEDSYDFEGMMNAAEQFQKLFLNLIDNIKKVNKNIYPLSAGACRLCARCALLSSEPCRNPDKAFPSLESHGIYVSDLASKTNMKYINGQNTVTYFGAVLF